MTDAQRTGGLNVYAVLGLPDAETMLVKAQLARRISDTIKSKNLTQAEASGLIGMPQPKLSGLLRGQFRGVSETKMMECLTRLGKDVEIVVKQAPHGRTGQVQVVSKRSGSQAKPAGTKLPATA